MHQILSESTGFCGRYDKKHFGAFSVHTVVIDLGNLSGQIVGLCKSSGQVIEVDKSP